MGEERILSSMAVLRIISGLIEIISAIAIIKLGQIAHALRINALLGIVGPIVYVIISALGVVAIAFHFSFWKIITIILGIVLVLWGTSAN